MDEKKQQEDQEMKEFLARKRSVTLTEDEWSNLTTYILFTTKFRAGEAKHWRKLAEQKLSDGTPVFPVAADDADWWEEIDRKLDRIRRIIDAPYLPPEEVADLCGQ